MALCILARSFPLLLALKPASLSFFQALFPVTDTVIYRCRLNPKINRNFEVFTPSGFPAAITQHIPDKDAQMVRYYGWYSNKMRGQRHRAETGGAAEKNATKT